jgi:aldehyde:ferredoxin oxidoreductase
VTVSYAFMGRILRVDLSQGKVSAEPIHDDWAKRFLGGAGLATRYLYEEVPRGTDALGPANKLIFMTGPLTGTTSASASRYSVVAKSPLTGIWGHANSGGTFGPALKRSGYDGVILRSLSKPYSSRLSTVKPAVDAESLWGRTVSTLKTDSGQFSDI